MVVRPRGGGAPPLHRNVLRDDASGVLSPPAVADRDAELTLPLDREELSMLEIFHKSFNLPGLRLGLVKPVAMDDYYPPEFEEDDAAEDAAPPASGSARGSGGARPPRRPMYSEPDPADRLNALLAQTRSLQLEANHTFGDDADTVEDEVVEEVVSEQPERVTAAAAAHQRQVRTSRPASGARPSSGAGSRPPTGGAAPSGRVRPSRW